MFFNAINCYIILKSVFLPNVWAGQQYQYLKHGGDNPVANKKMTLGQVVTNFTGQVVTSCLCVFLQFWAFKTVANLDFLVFFNELAYSATFETIFKNFITKIFLVFLLDIFFFSKCEKS